MQNYKRSLLSCTMHCIVESTSALVRNNFSRLSMYPSFILVFSSCSVNIWRSCGDSSSHVFTSLLSLLFASFLLTMWSSGNARCCKLHKACELITRALTASLQLRFLLVWIGIRFYGSNGYVCVTTVAPCCGSH